MKLPDLSEYKREYGKKSNRFRSDIESYFNIETKDEEIEILLSNIGSIDASIEGYENIENQRDLSIKFHWGHNHTFNNRFSVEGRMGDRHIKLLGEFCAGFNMEASFFSDREVLDVGCWTGGTSLSLYSLGARKVVGLEEVVKYARTSQTLVSKIYEKQNYTCISKSLYQTDFKGQFDIVYFPGVIYHLSDPVLALRILFNALKDGGSILVESAGINMDKPLCRFMGNRVFHHKQEEDKAKLNRGGWNWFLPSPSCLDLWLLEAGFEDPRSFFSPVSKRVFGMATRKKHVEITRAGLSVPNIE